MVNLLTRQQVKSFMSSHELEVVSLVFKAFHDYYIQGRPTFYYLQDGQYKCFIGQMISEDNYETTLEGFRVNTTEVKKAIAASNPNVNITDTAWDVLTEIQSIFEHVNEDNVEDFRASLVREIMTIVPGHLHSIIKEFARMNSTGKKPTTATVVRQWAGYCRGEDTVVVEVLDGMSEEDIIDAASLAFDANEHRNVIRDDRNKEEWEIQS